MSGLIKQLTLLFLLFVSCLLYGCVTPPSKVLIPEIEKCPKPTIPVQHPLQIKKLNRKSNSNLVIKALVLDLKQCESDNNEMRDELWVYYG